MSVEGNYRVTELGGESAEMIIRADEIHVQLDGSLILIGDRQKRRVATNLWRSITVENGGRGKSPSVVS